MGKIERMRTGAISEVAQRMGVRASTLRYYERIGILPRAPRVGGQRRYDDATLHRLAVILRARQAGFTLGQIRRLFYGFRDDVPPSRRWRELARQKLQELDAMMARIRSMQRLLRAQSCSCQALEECGRRILEQDGARATQASRADRNRPASARSR